MHRFYHRIYRQILLTLMNFYVMISGFFRTTNPMKIRCACSVEYDIHLKLRQLILPFLLALFSVYSRPLYCMPAHATVRYDTSKVNIRVIPKEAISAYHEDERFQYQQKSWIPVSIIQKIKLWFWEQIFKYFLPRGAGRFVQYLFYALLIGGVVFFILKLLKMNFTALFYKPRPIQNGLRFSASGQAERSDLDYDLLIGKSLSAGKYRLYIRYCYLKAIYLLSEKKMIVPRAEKTNWEYIREIQNPDLRALLEKLTRYFEYVWYGHFLLSESAVEPIGNDFKQFYRILSDETE